MSCLSPPSRSAHATQELAAFAKPIRLDIELYRHIIAYIDDKPDVPTWEPCMRLHDLLFVSKAWRAEAERYLYSYVTVPLGNILLFFDTLSHRPDLAKLVRELQFFSRSSKPPREGDFEIIGSGLKSLVGLRDLTMWTNSEPEDEFPDYIVSRYDTHILRGPFPFKLYRFVTDILWSEEQRDFLVAQDEIRILRLTGPLRYTQDFWKLPSTALPYLRCIHSVPGLLRDFECSPQITHAQLAIYGHSAVDEAKGAADLVRISEFLMVLSISRNTSPPDVPCLSPAAMLSQFVSCSQLSFLGLYDLHSNWTPRDRAQILRIVTENFPTLEAFAFDSFHSLPDQRADWDDSEWDEYLTDSDEEASGADRMLAYTSDIIMRHKTGSLRGVIVCGWNRKAAVTAFLRTETEDIEALVIHAAGNIAGGQDCYEFLDPIDVLDFILGYGYDVGRFENPVNRNKSLWRPAGYDQFLRHVHPFAIIPSHRIFQPRLEPRTWKGIQTANFSENPDPEA